MDYRGKRARLDASDLVAEEVVVGLPQYSLPTQPGAQGQVLTLGAPIADKPTPVVWTNSVIPTAPRTDMTLRSSAIDGSLVPTWREPLIFVGTGYRTLNTLADYQLTEPTQKIRGSLGFYIAQPFSPMVINFESTFSTVFEGDANFRFNIRLNSTEFRSSAFGPPAHHETAYHQFHIRARVCIFGYNGTSAGVWCSGSVVGSALNGGGVNASNTWRNVPSGLSDISVPSNAITTMTFLCGDPPTAENLLVTPIQSIIPQLSILKLAGTQGTNQVFNQLTTVTIE